MSYLPIDLQVERRQTQMLIDLYGYPIQINRPGPLTKTSAGGYARSGGDQTFPPVNRYLSVQGREQFTPLGNEGGGPKVKQYILGPYGDDLQAGDWFTDPITGRKYTIQYVHPDQTVETRGEIEPIE